MFPMIMFPFAVALMTVSPSASEIGGPQVSKTNTISAQTRFVFETMTLTDHAIEDVNVHLINADGSGLVDIGKSPANEVLIHVAYDHVIFFRTNHGVYEGIFTAGLDGSNPTKVSDKRVDIIGFTPDRIVLRTENRRHLYSVDYAGNNEILLEDRTVNRLVLQGDDLVYECSSSNWRDSINWVAADGSARASLASAGDEMLQDMAGDLVVFRHADAVYVIHKYGDDRPTKVSGNLADAYFMGYDGSRLIITSGSRLYSVRTNGTSMRTLTPAGSRANYMGHIGSRILYISKNNRGTGYLKSVRNTGSYTRNIAYGVDANTTRVLENRVVYALPNGQDDKVDWFSARSTGRTKRNLINNINSRAEFIYDRLGWRMIFSTAIWDQGRDDRDLYAVRLDGSSFANLADSADIEEYGVGSGSHQVYQRAYGALDKRLLIVGNNGRNPKFLANTGRDENCSCVLLADGTVVNHRMPGL